MLKKRAIINVDNVFMFIIFIILTVMFVARQRPFHPKKDNNCY